MDFTIPLAHNDTPLFSQVYAGVRAAILSGVLPAGGRLPSTRDLADQLGISRTVVLLAYDQLLAEGFAEGRRGSGTYVARSLQRGALKRAEKPARLRLSRFGNATSDAAGTLTFPNRPRSHFRYDFAFGRSDTGVFPFEAWRRILMRHAAKIHVRDLDYGPAAGTQALRESICSHVQRSRAVVCDPSQVIIVNGAQQGLDLIARVLVEPGDTVALEDPQYQGMREVLRAAGARLFPVPVDRDGLDPAKLPIHAKLVLVTPSHQFPTGTILPLARRLALLDWAQRKNAIIVEDDYDGEFHYAGHPLESLQGLDTKGRTIYVGTFSRTIFPALRIGYLVVPKSVATEFTTAKWLCDQHSATLEQQALAEFISSGLYERHLRRLRRRNALRRNVLLEAISKNLAARVEVTGAESGAHVVLWPKKRISEATAIDRAALLNIGINGTSHCYLGDPPRTGLILGYANLNEDEIHEGICRLGTVL